MCTSRGRWAPPRASIVVNQVRVREGILRAALIQRHPKKGYQVQVFSG